MTPLLINLKVSTSGEWLCKLSEQPVQKATTTVCACLTALSHIPAGVYVQLKKRSWSLLKKAKGNSHIQRTTHGFQEEAEKHYMCFPKCNAGWEAVAGQRSLSGFSLQLATIEVCNMHDKQVLSVSAWKNGVCLLGHHSCPRHSPKITWSAESIYGL